MKISSFEYIVAHIVGKGGAKFPEPPLAAYHSRLLSKARAHRGLNESGGSRVTKFARRVPMKNSGRALVGRCSASTNKFLIGKRSIPRGIILSRCDTISRLDDFLEILGNFKCPDKIDKIFILFD